MGYIIPGSLLVFMIGSLIAVKVELSKRPTFKDLSKKEHLLREDLRRKDLCEQTHKSVDEKLSCLPEIKDTVTTIKTKIEMFLQKNGAKQ